MWSAIPLTLHSGHSVDRSQSSAAKPRSSASNAARSGRSIGVRSREAVLGAIGAGFGVEPLTTQALDSPLMLASRSAALMRS